LAIIPLTLRTPLKSFFPYSIVKEHIRFRAELNAQG
jgi:hypothetical protein